MKGDLLPALRKAQVSSHIVSRMIFGGDANEYVTLGYLENFAAIDQPPPVVRALGAEGASKLTAKLAGIVQRTERRILRYVPELSFRVKTTS